LNKNPLFGQLAMEMRATIDIQYFIEHILGINWLWPKQKEVLFEFYNPERSYQDLVLVAGMRSGKTTVASIIACYEAFKLISCGAPCKKYGLPKGTEIFIVNVSTSERQARDTVFAHIKARIDYSPWFKQQRYTEHFNEFVFHVQDGKVIIRSEHSNSASLAGKSIITVIFDELARFKDTGGNSSGEMVWDTLSRSVKTFGKDGKRISISSPIYVDDYQMQLFRWGQQTETVYARRLATWEMNPTITFESLASEFEKNPETAWRDYGAIPNAAIETYFKEPEKIDAVVDTGRSVVVENGLPQISIDNSHVFTLAGDPALKNDAFGFALVHREGEKMFVDLAYRFSPSTERREVDAQQIKRFVVSIAQQCRLNLFVTDTWQFPETIQAIEDQGVRVVQNHVGKQEYDYLKELIYGGPDKISLPNYPVLIQELKSLEITKGKKINHPRGGSKDVADAVANACWLEKQEAGSFEEPVVHTFGV